MLFLGVFNVVEQPAILLLAVPQQLRPVILGVNGAGTPQVHQDQIPITFPPLAVQVEPAGEQGPVVFCRAFGVLGQRRAGLILAGKQPQLLGAAKKEVEQKPQPRDKRKDQQPSQRAAHLLFAEKQQGDRRDQIGQIK